MDIKSLQCFVAVAENLNFSKAAQSLFISQPSLSIRINALEDELGCSLFFRNHQQVFLTEAGATLLPEVRDILARLDGLKGVVQCGETNDQEPSGKLYIGMDTQEDRTDLPFLLEAFASIRNRFPQAEILCSTVDFDDYEKKLISGEYDICIMIMRPSDKVNPLFSTAPLLRESIVLFAENAGDATAEELIRDRELLMLEKGDRQNQTVLNFLNSKKWKYSIRYVGGTPAMCMTLRGGKAVAFLPRLYAEQMDPNRTSVFNLQIPDSTVTLTAIWNKRDMKPIIQHMINELVQAADGKMDN